MLFIFQVTYGHQKTTYLPFLSDTFKEKFSEEEKNNKKEQTSNESNRKKKMSVYKAWKIFCLKVASWQTKAVQTQITGYAWLIWKIILVMLSKGIKCNLSLSLCWPEVEGKFQCLDLANFFIFTLFEDFSPFNINDLRFSLHFILVFVGSTAEEFTVAYRKFLSFDSKFVESLCTKYKFTVLKIELKHIVDPWLIYNNKLFKD